MSTKENAMARGTLKATIHSMHRRSQWHDYSSPRIYMLTLVTMNRQRLFGTLTGDPHLPLYTPGAASVKLSELGLAILRDEVPKISRYYPMVEVWKVCVMPDHLHIIVTVKEQMPAGKHLGIVIKGFKQGCNKAFWHIFNLTSIHPALFEPNYCDKILSDPGQLDRWKHYLEDNPRRLMLKTMNPAFFSVRHHLSINGRQCAAIGNLFLLDIPDKMEVVVHRRDSDDEYKDKMKVWMQLILSPWPEAAPEKNGITRQECLQLNALATQMAQGQFELG